MASLLVRDPAALDARLASFRGAGRLALDVEGDGLYRYRARVCTMQLATEDEAMVVDTLAIEDLGALAGLIGDDAPEKVVHDVSFDARMLAQRGLSFGRVFDTAVAARFLGEKSTGLATLLETYFDVSLDKAHQQADWGERPLPPPRIEYLLADVRHLPALAALLEDRARALDVLEEIEEETRYAIARALEPDEVREPWTRVKGGKTLAPEDQGVLAALADLREREAERRDVPPFRVTSNRVLFEAARRRPRGLRDLREIRGLRTFSDADLEAALARAAREGPPRTEPSGPVPSPEERARRKAREKALSRWRKAEAEARGVDPQVVLPGHCLRDAARLEDPDALAEVPGLGDKRLDRYGSAIRALLAST